MPEMLNTVTTYPGPIPDGRQVCENHWLQTPAGQFFPVVEKCPWCRIEKMEPVVEAAKVTAHECRIWDDSVQAIIGRRPLAWKSLAALEDALRAVGEAEPPQKVGLVDALMIAVRATGKVEP